MDSKTNTEHCVHHGLAGSQRAVTRQVQHQCGPAKTLEGGKSGTTTRQISRPSHAFFYFFNSLPLYNLLQQTRFCCHRRRAAGSLFTSPAMGTEPGRRPRSIVLFSCQEGSLWLNVAHGGHQTVPAPVLCLRQGGCVQLARQLERPRHHLRASGASHTGGSVARGFRSDAPSRDGFTFYFHPQIKNASQGDETAFHNPRVKRDLKEREGQTPLLLGCI